MWGDRSWAQLHLAALARPSIAPPSSPKCMPPTKAPYTTRCSSPTKSQNLEYLPIRSPTVMTYELHLRVYDGTIITGLYRPQRLIKPRWALTKLASRPGERHRRGLFGSGAGLGTIATRRHRGGSVVGPGSVRAVLWAHGTRIGLHLGYLSPIYERSCGFWAVCVRDMHRTLDRPRTRAGGSGRSGIL